MVTYIAANLIGKHPRTVMDNITLLLAIWIDVFFEVLGIFVIFG